MKLEKKKSKTQTKFENKINKYINFFTHTIFMFRDSRFQIKNDNI